MARNPAADPSLFGEIWILHIRSQAAIFALEMAFIEETDYILTMGKFLRIKRFVFLNDHQSMELDQWRSRFHQMLGWNDNQERF
jgi:hypothetical protein